MSTAGQVEALRAALAAIYNRAGDQLWKSRQRSDSAGHHCDYRGALQAVKDIAKRGLSNNPAPPDRCTCGHLREQHVSGTYYCGQGCYTSQAQHDYLVGEWGERPVCERFHPSSAARAQAAA